MRSGRCWWLPCLVPAFRQARRRCGAATPSAAPAKATPGELDAIVGEDDLDLVGHGCDECVEEGAGADRVGLLDKLHELGFEVRSIATYRYNLPSSVLTSARSMWKKPIG